MDGEIKGLLPSNNKYRTAADLTEHTSANAYGAFQTDASRSSSTYQDGAPVQERATEMYLYFYVGNTVAVESEINLDTLVADVENLKKGSGGSLEIGDIGFSAFGIDETKNLRRYLNGQVISQIQFTAFTTRLKEVVALYPNLATTETNWQAEVTNSKLGQCGKFVIDDTAGTIRLPKVVNINGLQNLANLGGIKAESLPNIKGNLKFTQSTDRVADGCFERATEYENTTKGGGDINGIPTLFNASLSSSTYKDNAPVQQEAVQYPYFIQVATGLEESIDVTREIELNNPFSLGDSRYTPNELTNLSWLKSDGEFHSGTTYSSFYNWILENVNNGVKGFIGQTMYAHKDPAEGKGYYMLTTATPKVGSVVYGQNRKHIVGRVIQINADNTIEIKDEDNTIPFTASNCVYAPSENISSADYITDYDYVINTADTTFRLPVYDGSENLPGPTAQDWSSKITVGTVLTLTMPTNGFLYIYATANNNNYARIYLGCSTEQVNPSSKESAAPLHASIFAKKGDTITTTVDNATLNFFYYSPAQGNGSLYYYVGESIQGANLINMESTLLDVASLKKNALKTNQITNCITEIPQDIKYTLVDSIFTLKAGSKVYVPNGFEEDGTTPKFDEVVIENDITTTADYGKTGKMLVYVRGDLVDVASVFIIKSGETQPTETNNGFVWYDTANNVIKRYNPNNTTWEILSSSLPVAEVQSISNVVTSIDQVFNGFGYIGNSMFLLPDVKYLIPDGRDSKGNLQNIESKTNKVSVYNNVDFQNATWFLVIKEDDIGISDKDLYDKISNTVIYDVKQNWAFCGKFTMDSAGKITSLTPKTTFEALDKNDTSFLSSLGMPSARYVDLTLGSSGSTYKAPANGYFVVRCKATSVGNFLYIQNLQNYMSMWDVANYVNNELRIWLPVQKKQNVTVEYNTTSVNYFRFVYAEGE